MNRPYYRNMENKVFTRSIVSFKRRPTHKIQLFRMKVGIEFLVVGEEKRMIYDI